MNIIQQIKKYHTFNEYCTHNIGHFSIVKTIYVRIWTLNLYFMIDLGNIFIFWFSFINYLRYEIQTFVCVRLRIRIFFRLNCSHDIILYNTYYTFMYAIMLCVFTIRDSIKIRCVEIGTYATSLSINYRFPTRILWRVSVWLIE